MQGATISAWGTKDEADANTHLRQRMQAGQIREFDLVMRSQCRPACLFQGPRMLAVNKAWENMTGHARKDVVGKTMSILQGPSTALEAMRTFTEALYNGQDASATFLNYTKDGTLFRNYARVHCLPEGMFLGFFEYIAEEEVEETKADMIVEKKEQPITIKMTEPIV